MNRLDLKKQSVDLVYQTFTKEPVIPPTIEGVEAGLSTWQKEVQDIINSLHHIDIYGSSQTSQDINERFRTAKEAQLKFKKLPQQAAPLNHTLTFVKLWARIKFFFQLIILNYSLWKAQNLLDKAIDPNYQKIC